jgi:sugar O-acyltransferase (sialic acid O-acetyltransferase NeuD family)
MSQDLHDLLIISAGKYGRVTLRLAQEAIKAGAPWRIKGFLDNRPDALAPFGYTEPILGPVETYVPQPNDRFLCAVGDNDARRRYAEMILARGGQFATLVHPTSCIADRASIGPGTIIEPFVYVGTDVSIGAFNVIGSHTCISHDNRIGDYSQVCGHSNFGGNVVVEDHAFFGLGAIVVPRITIGRYAFVAAGSIVVADVPASSKVFGNPAMEYGRVNGAYAK